MVHGPGLKRLVHGPGPQRFCIRPANGSECCSKRDSIVEMRSFVFVICVCICCKVLRIKSKDFPSDEGDGLGVFRLLGGLSLCDRSL